MRGVIRDPLTAVVGEVIETSLEVHCDAPARFVATVTIATGDATAAIPWTVHCGSGNIAVVIVELHQGPMSWVWNSVAQKVTTYVDPIPTRRAAMVARVATGFESNPRVVVTVRDDEEAVVSKGLSPLVRRGVHARRISHGLLAALIVITYVPWLSTWFT